MKKEIKIQSQARDSRVSSLEAEISELQKALHSKCQEHEDAVAEANDCRDQAERLKGELNLKVDLRW